MSEWKTQSFLQREKISYLILSKPFQVSAFSANEESNYLVNQLEFPKNAGSMREKSGTQNLYSSPTAMTTFINI